ncbi:MAG: AAA family ATPase [Magnetococcales bacterium]|nr:AAA family ATPase [Magnetococcales bacterium]
MLIEFTVANFRSIHEPIVLDLSPVAQIRSLSGNAFPSGLKGQPRRLLRTAVVYGPNASGKSNLIRAAHFMRRLVLNSNRKEVDAPLFKEPFLLAPESGNRPGQFEMIFVANRVRYQYGFEVDRQRVVQEWLYAFPNERARTIFTRAYQADGDRFHVESDLGVGIVDVVQALPEDWLALTRMGQQKPTLCPELEAVYKWFRDKLIIMSNNGTVNHVDTLDCLENENGRQWVLDFLRAADLVIDDLMLENISERRVMITDIKLVEINEDVNKLIKEQRHEDKINYFDRSINYELGSETLKIVRTVSTTGEKKLFNLGQESAGTIRMLALAGQWKSMLDNGQVCFLDEIEAGLHPKLARFLLELFQDPATNPNNAQLITTTHDTTLLDQTLLRPDQVWLMNKKRDHASHFYALSDFDLKGRRGNLQRDYLDGLFGAVPMVLRKQRLSELGAVPISGETP